MHDTNDITPQPQSLIACGNKTNSLESLTLRRQRQLEQAATALQRIRHEFLTQYGWTKFLAVSPVFKPLRKESDKNSFGECLAYLSSPIEKNKLDEPVMKQLGRKLYWEGAMDADAKQSIVRIERIITQILKLQRHTAYPGCKSRLTHKQFPSFEANAVQVAEHVRRWSQWMISKPYDKEGILTDPWKRRITYFTSHQHKFGLLAESSPFELWSMFLDPTWWLRLRTSYYGMILRQIVNCPYILSSARTQLRWKYDASGYSRARKSSRLRKSIRAEVETAIPQTWSVQAVYGHR
ncbi:MAG: hypothetical protein Q9204_003743 [Flavoplaca sp. TL-2023a]